MILAGTGGNALAAYQVEKKQGAQRYEAFKKDPQLTKALADFEKSVARLKTTDDFFKDRKLVEFVTKAFGKPDEINFIGRLKRILSEDPSSDKAVVKRLNDGRLTQIAETLNFAVKGLDNLKDPKVLADLKTSYTRYAYDERVSGSDPVLADALYFEENAAKADSYFAVLGDAKLRRVLTANFGLPPQLALQSLTSQVKAFESRFSLDDLKDPKFVQRQVQQYLVTQGSGAGGGSAGAASAALTILGGNGGGGLGGLINLVT